MWEIITNIVLIISILILAIFAVLGLYQWITRKSIKKVDIQLLWMPVPVVLAALTYLLFDKLLPAMGVIIATRPNGSGEPSFPSTHVLIAATILFVTTIVLPKYIKSKGLRIVAEILIIICIALVCSGRVMANLHSPIDVVVALILAFIYSEIYFFAIRKTRKKIKAKKAAKEDE